MVMSLPNKVYLNTSIHVGHFVIKSNSFPISTSIPSVFAKTLKLDFESQHVRGLPFKFSMVTPIFTNSCHFMPRNTKNSQLLVDKLAQDLFDVTI
jgi:hypothetical protein